MRSRALLHHHTLSEAILAMDGARAGLNEDSQQVTRTCVERKSPGQHKGASGSGAGRVLWRRRAVRS
jgi:hypothetical protein